MQATLPPSRRSIKIYVTVLTVSLGAILLLWPEAVRAFFGSGAFMPHAFCYRFDPRLIWMNGISDALIGLSYVAISAMLTLLVHRSRHDIPFSWIFLAFGLFIIACGGTHIMEVITLYKPAYWLSGAVKIVTAIASVATALVLPPLIPKALAMVQAAKQSEERRVQLQERLEALESERAARVEAEEASRSKDTFLATLSHELRTPMTTILGWSSMINAGDVDEQTQRTGVTAIEQSARAQAQLIDDLLDVSRIVTGKMTLQPRAIEINDVIRAAIETTHWSAEQKGVRIEVTYGLSSRSLVGDPARLHQVFTNLLVNAIKFTPSGGRVGITTSAEGNEAVVEIADSGIGIAPEFLSKIFDRFSQADDTNTRGYGGLGLGLAIVRSIAELHGGSVSAESEGEQRGAAFTVRLPFTATAAPAEHIEAEEPAGTHNLTGMRVMLIEDDPNARGMMTEVLRRAGADVQAFAGASSALDHFTQDGVDVVVTDIAMPGQDGLTLLKKIRLREVQALPRTPVIAVSALARADERNRILMAGFDDYLQKPVEPAALVAAVARVVMRRT